MLFALHIKQEVGIKQWLSRGKLYMIDLYFKLLYYYLGTIKYIERLSVIKK